LVVGEAYLEPRNAALLRSASKAQLSRIDLYAFGAAFTSWRVYREHGRNKPGFL